MQRSIRDSFHSLGSSPGQQFNRVRSHLRTPLYRNGYALLVTAVTTSLLGIVFWAAAVRFYTADMVGFSSAAISAMVLVTGLASFSLQGVLVRFLPAAGAKAARLILLAYAIHASMALLLGTLFIHTVALWAPNLQRAERRRRGRLGLRARRRGVVHVQSAGWGVDRAAPCGLGAGGEHSLCRGQDGAAGAAGKRDAALGHLCRLGHTGGGRDHSHQPAAVPPACAAGGQGAQPPGTGGGSRQHCQVHRPQLSRRAVQPGLEFADAARRVTAGRAARQCLLLYAVDDLHRAAARADQPCHLHDRRGCARRTQAGPVQLSGARAEPAAAGAGGCGAAAGRTLAAAGVWPGVCGAGGDLGTPAGAGGDPQHPGGAVHQRPACREPRLEPCAGAGRTGGAAAGAQLLAAAAVGHYRGGCRGADQPDPSRRRVRTRQDGAGAA